MPDKKRRRRRGSNQKLGFYLTLPALIFVAIFTFYPFGYAFYSSFTKNIIYRPEEIGDFNGLGNYASVVNSSYFASAVQNTLIFSVASAVLIVVLAVAVASMLNNKYRGLGMVRFLIFIPWAIPPAAAGVIWRQMLQPSGWFNKILGVFGVVDEPVYFLATDQSLLVLFAVAAQLWQQMPFAVLLLTAVFLLIPKEVIEAASVDGASGLRLFREIIFPYLKTVVPILLAFEALIALNTYDLVYTFTGGVWGLLSYYAFAEGFNFGNLGNGSALSIILALITLGLIGVILIFLPPEKMYRYSFVGDD